MESKSQKSPSYIGLHKTKSHTDHENEKNAISEQVIFKNLRQSTMHAVINDIMIIIQNFGCPFARNDQNMRQTT